MSANERGEQDKPAAQSLAADGNSVGRDLVMVSVNLPNADLNPSLLERLGVGARNPSLPAIPPPRSSSRASAPSTGRTPTST